MFSPGQQRYDEFIKIFKEANVDLTKENQYKKGQELWKTSCQNHQAIEDKSSKKEKYFARFLDQNCDSTTRKETIQ